MAGPPRQRMTADSTVSKTDRVSSCTTSRLNIVYRTMAKPSFSKLSPSIRMDRLSTTPSSFNIATTATGSVADSIDPTMKDVAQSQPYGSTYLAVSPSRAVLTSTAGPASVNTGVSCCKNR
jgi:2',3'-cyclic-nucleotide 2'-phosphodiesterase (5'-nucleotidase family)